MFVLKATKNPILEWFEQTSQHVQNGAWAIMSASFKALPVLNKKPESLEEKRAIERKLLFARECQND